MNRLQANLCLLTVVICWSFEYILQKNIPPSVPVPAVMTHTFLLGCFILAVLFHKKLKQNITKDLCIKVAGLGLVSLLYKRFFLEATRYLPTDLFIFLNTLPLALLPVLLLLFFHEKKPWQVWLGDLLVVLGILGTLDWNFPMQQSKGLGFMVAYSVIYSLYIIFLNKLAKKEEPFSLTTLMLGTIGLLSLFSWIIPDPTVVFKLEYSKPFVASIFGIAYLICGFATALNVTTQKYLSPLDSVAIYCMQPAVVLIMSVTMPPILARKFALTSTNVLCCLIITVGAYLCQVNWALLKEQLVTKPQHPSISSKIRTTLTSANSRWLILKLFIVYLIVALPFKLLDILPGFANIRPNSALIPVYGLLFGPAGAFACGLGNFFYDLLTGSLSFGSPAGLIANFCVPLLIYRLWYHFVGKPFELGTLEDLAWYIVIIIIGALTKALLITPVVGFFYPEVGSEAFLRVLLSTELVFYLVPAIALLVFLQKAYGIKGYE